MTIFSRALANVRERSRARDELPLLSSTLVQKLTLFVGLACLSSCSRAPSADAVSTVPIALASASAQPPVPSSPASPQHAAPAPSGPAATSAIVYPWLADKAPGTPEVVDDLQSRFPAPQGFTRAESSAHSFGRFLRSLPLAAAGTPVRSYSGQALYPVDDPRIAAVVAIDVGDADLQQCADSVLRMHAEWQWSEGKRDMSYHAAAGPSMGFATWTEGYRPVMTGSSLAWKPAANPVAPDHAHFRKYLNDVFAWANTGSLSREGAQIDVSSLKAGDFVVKPGGPGHAVLVLDIATSPTGKRRALLGQGYMPAQSFQVLKDASGSPWFEIDPNAPLTTPFWQPFPWSLLRRLATSE